MHSASASNLKTRSPNGTVISLVKLANQVARHNEVRTICTMRLQKALSRWDSLLRQHRQCYCVGRSRVFHHCGSGILVD